MAAFLVLFFFKLCCVMQALAPWPGIRPRPPALEAWSLNRCTTREVPERLRLLNLGYIACQIVYHYKQCIPLKKKIYIYIYIRITSEKSICIMCQSSYSAGVKCLRGGNFADSRRRKIHTLTCGRKKGENNNRSFMIWLMHILRWININTEVKC